MKLNVQERYHAHVVEIKGKFFGSRDGDAFKELFDDLKMQGKTNLVVDLSETEFLDSSAIGALIRGLTTMRTAGGDVRLANIERRIRNVFIITRLLGPVFEDYDSVEDAANSYVKHPAAEA